MNPQVEITGREDEALHAFLEPEFSPGSWFDWHNQTLYIYSSTAVAPAMQDVMYECPEVSKSSESAAHLENGQYLEPTYSLENVAVYSEDGRRQATVETERFTMSVTPHGIISLRLSNGIRVDITVNKSVRIINPAHNIIISLSANGASSAVLHPNGCVWQYGSRVDLVALDECGNNKYAKMWYRGINFSSDSCALVYLVDDAGTRTTMGKFQDLTQDFSLPVFFENARCGPVSVPEALVIENCSQYWINGSSTQNWLINNVRISLTRDGLLRVARNGCKYQMVTSSTNGKVSLSTPFLHCTASLGQTPHLFVRRGERRMHYDGSNFIVRNAGHSAGFDRNNQVKVF